MSNQQPANDETTSGLEVVTVRNGWYRDRYSTVLRIAFVAVLAVVLEAAVIVALMVMRPEPVYFAVSTDGAVIKMVPVNEPLLSNAALQQWAGETARSAYALDFVHYAQQMTAIRDRFSSTAFRDYVAKMTESGNLAAIKTSRMVMDAQSEPAVIVGAGVVKGRMQWRIEVGLTVLTHFGSDQTRTQHIKVLLEIVRVDNRFRPESGVVVNRFITSMG